MGEEQIIDLVRLTLFTASEISAPILVILLVIGLGGSVFQSVTQVTESTLIFIPKLIFFTIAFALTLPWILKIMIRYSYDIFINHWESVMHNVNTLT